jgi:hypothetical protein
MILSSSQLAVVADAVAAVVERDPTRLSGLVGDADALYTWTRDYGDWDEVELVLPPGEPERWELDAVAVAAKPPLVHVVVPMWTRQEGRSDLSLEITLSADSSGAWTARIEDLHVL